MQTSKSNSKVSLSSPNSLLNPTPTKLSQPIEKFPDQAAAMDQSREVFNSGGNKVKETARKEAVSKRSTELVDDDINDQAEAFIKNFRNQLKMQREESLKRFHEMIARGV